MHFLNALFSTTQTTHQQIAKIKHHMQLKITPNMFLEDKKE